MSTLDDYYQQQKPNKNDELKVEYNDANKTLSILDASQNVIRSFKIKQNRNTSASEYAHEAIEDIRKGVDITVVENNYAAHAAQEAMDTSESDKGKKTAYRRRYKVRRRYTPPYAAQPQFGGVFKWKMSPQFYAETRLTDFTKPMPRGTMIGKYQSLMQRAFANCSRLFRQASKDYLMVKAKMKYDWLKIMKIRKPMLRLAYRLFPRYKADDIKKKITSIIGGKILQSNRRFRRGYRYRKKRRIY